MKFTPAACRDHVNDAMLEQVPRIEIPELEEPSKP